MGNRYINSIQQQAIKAPLQSVLVIGAAGTGKSFIVPYRVAYLVDKQHIPPNTIRVFTHTRETANAIDAQIRKICLNDTVGIRTMTIFRACVNILRKLSSRIGFANDFLILDEDEQIWLIRDTLRELRIDEIKYPPYKIKQEIGLLKSQLISPENYQTESNKQEIFQRIYREYNKRLLAENLMDFEDLVTNTIFVLTQSPVPNTQFRFILLDGIHKLNSAQYTLIKLLSGSNRNIFALGDPDQVIYSYNGSTGIFFEEFQKDFSPLVFTLNENYRSQKMIVDIALDLINNNHLDMPRRVTSQREATLKVSIHNVYNEKEESEYIVETIQHLISTGQYQFRDFAVLYRLNIQSSSLEEVFTKNNIPFFSANKQKFLRHKETKDLLAYLGIVNDLNHQINRNRVKKLPSQLIINDKALQILNTSKDELTPLQILDHVLSETSYISYLQQDRFERQANRVEAIHKLRLFAENYSIGTLAQFLDDVVLEQYNTDFFSAQRNEVALLTLHRCLELEFPVVFLAGLEEGLLPHAEATNAVNPAIRDYQIGEERRLMYTGLTRARDSLYITYTFKRMLWGYNDVRTPSRFLHELPLANVTASEEFTPIVQNLFSQPQKQWDTTWEPRRRPDTPPKPNNLITGGNPPPAPQKPQQPTRFKSGQRVLHVKYGEGVVIKSRVHDDIEEVEVLFTQQVGSKRIDGNYLQPLKGEES